jgi:biopolymer transport protein ExbB
MTLWRLQAALRICTIVMALLILPGISAVSAQVAADTGTGNDSVAATTQANFFSVREFLAAGGMIGFVILILSFLMLALVIDALLTTRRVQIIPQGLAETIHRLIGERKRKEAIEQCRQTPGFLSAVLESGLNEMVCGAWPPIEKSMEDAAAEQGARCSRRVEYLAIISTLAPMLGLMGTVWGMIVAFMEFELKANPQISELAPGIYKALVTTLLGLGVAIPATAALAFFRSRIEDLTAEATLLADRVFADHRRGLQSGRLTAQPREHSR